MLKPPLPKARPPSLPLGFKARKEEETGTNRLWRIVRGRSFDFGYVAALRGRPGLRFTGTSGGATITSIVSALACGVATASLTTALDGAGATTSIVPALANGAASGFSRNWPSPMAFANADRCAA